MSPRGGCPDLSEEGQRHRKLKLGIGKKKDDWSVDTHSFDYYRRRSKGTNLKFIKEGSASGTRWVEMVYQGANIGGTV